MTAKIIKKLIGAITIFSALTIPVLSSNSQITKVNAITATSVSITNIKIVGTQYSVAFAPLGYTPTQGGLHTHFYYNTEANAVTNKMFFGPSPYSIDISTKPVGAVQLCAIVAEANHAVIANSGNCIDLPTQGQSSSSSSLIQQISSADSKSSLLQGSITSSSATPIQPQAGGVITITTVGTNQISSSNSSSIDNNEYCTDGLRQRKLKGKVLTSTDNDRCVNHEESSCPDFDQSTGVKHAINTKGSGGQILNSELISCDQVDFCKDGDIKYDTAKKGYQYYVAQSDFSNARSINPDDCIKTKKQIPSLVANTDLFQFEDGTHLINAKKGWDGTIKGIVAGDQLVIEEPCQGSFGQVSLTFKKAITEGGLKLTEIDQNNLFPNLVGDISNGCNMSISGFDKDDVSEARVYLGNDFIDRLNSPTDSTSQAKFKAGADLAKYLNKIQDEAETVKVIEKATSGLKDTLKTQVRSAIGPCKFPYLCGDEEDYTLGLETDNGELFSWGASNSGIQSVDSWSLGATNSPSTGGSGTSAGKASLQDIHFTSNNKNHVGHVTLIKQRTDGDKKYVGTVTIVKKDEPDTSVDFRRQYEPLLIRKFQEVSDLVGQINGPCKPPYLCSSVTDVLVDAKTGHVSLIKGKQTQGGTFGEKVNAGLHAAGGIMSSGGKLTNPTTGLTYTAQYSNSPWKTADINVDDEGRYYASIPSAFKQFAITKGVLDFSADRDLGITLARTGGSSDSIFGTRLVIFLLLSSFITIKTYEKN